MVCETLACMMVCDENPRDMVDTTRSREWVSYGRRSCEGERLMHSGSGIPSRGGCVGNQALAAWDDRDLGR